MKRILALALSGALMLGVSGVTVATAASKDAPVPREETTETERAALYLVPGTYMSSGQKIENAISSGADKLTTEECNGIFTENAYLCTLSTGDTLPVPTSERKDGDGNAYSFNGWWSIADATVTYFKTVPDISETTFLYADWRADLSQRKDPVAPDPSLVVEHNHYMNIKRAATGETEKIILRHGFTDMSNAATLGYGAAVQLYNEYLELNPGDVFSVYTTGLDENAYAVGDGAQAAPVFTKASKYNRTITLEASGDKTNDTSDYLTYNAAAGNPSLAPTLTYSAETAGVYKIYIKFYSDGNNMAVYMEPVA